MVGFIFSHYLKRTLKEPVGLGILVGLPVILIVILSGVYNNNFEGNVYVDGFNMISTNIAIPMMVSFQFFGGSILLDHLHADFRSTRKSRLFATPIKNSHFLAGAFLGSLLASFVQGVLVLIISSLFLKAYFGNLWITLTVMLISGMIAQLLVLIWFILFPKKSTAEAFVQITSWGMMIGSGFTFGTPEAPNALQEFLMTYLPLSLGINAIMDSGFIHHYDMDGARLNLGILIVTVAILALVTYFLSKTLNREEAKIEASTKQKPITDYPKINAPAMLNLHTPMTRRIHLTVFRFGIVRGLKNWVSILFNMAVPVGLIFVSELWTGQEQRGFYFLAGSLMFGSLPACKSLLNDKLEGTYRRIHLSPISKASYLFQSVVSGFIPLFIPVVVVIVLGSILYHWESGFMLGLFILYTLFAMASVALIMAWRNLFSEKEASSVAFSVGMSLVAMLGGVWMPLEIMPEILRILGGLFPVYWVSLSLNSLLNFGINWQFGMYLLILVLFISAYTLFGIKGRKEVR
jgi:ABC-type multidrug transport system permease subunit